MPVDGGEFTPLRLGSGQNPSQVDNLLETGNVTDPRKLTVMPMYSTFPFLYSGSSGSEITDAFGQGQKGAEFCEQYELSSGSGVVAAC